MLKESWRRVSPFYLFVWGLVIMITFLFQEDLSVRIGESLFFILLAVATGKRFRILPNLIVVLGVTLVHLITPHGRILLSLGAFRITQGALEVGLYKGFLLVGLIYISRSFISPRLTLPGRGGAMLGLTFAYFERLTESRGAFSPRAPWASTDKLLLSLWEEAPPEVGNGTETARKFSPLWLLPPLVGAVQGGLLFL